MSNDFEFSIRESTLAKLLSLKNEEGFDKKSWDEWFNHLLNQNSVQKPSQKEIEKTMEKLHYESFDEWVQNFAINLNNIWNESSARELDPTSNQKSYLNNSAIVIGRGPSLKKHKHLELIAKSDYKGSIVCCDGALINVLNAGITPEKFPKFFVVTIDPYKHAIKFYDDKIVDKYGQKIKGVFSTLSNPTVVERVREAGIKIHWLHSLFDYGEGKKSFNHVSALMVRTKKHLNGLPALQTGGNVGTASWFVSWQILKNSTVSLAGINHGWEEDDPWETIITHGRKADPRVFGNEISVNIDRNDPAFNKLFKKIYNPEFKCYCILDPLFQFYSEALKEFILRSPTWLTTINATEGGSIFGERIKCMSLENFLKNYKN
jgi:hypothetical protein